MAIVKARAPGAKKKTRRRAVAAEAAVVALPQKKARKARTSTVAQEDLFDPGSVVSPRVRQDHVQRSSLVLAPTTGQGTLLMVNEPAAPLPVSRRHDWLLLFVVLLLVAASFLLGRLSYRPAGAPVDFQSAAPASSTAPVAGTLPAATRPVPTTAPAVPLSAASKPKPHTVSALVASIKAKVAGLRHGSGSSLREVSVGTSSHGGLTLKFDQPVSWATKDNGGRGEAEVDIAGVHNLGTFPRNLPLPPGVMVIHAGITGPDTLRLWFTLLPGLKIFSAPDSGPSQALNVFFRADPAGDASPTASPAARTIATPITQG
ncbi:MAG: hypothetical protein ACHQAU_06005 [Gammaproteobacteria bacterium]